MDIKHKKFPKIGRYKEQKIVVTEKLDGTNGLVYVDLDTDTILAGSRNRWVTPEDDNYGFAQWVENNREDLKGLGDGFHYGEWWGKGIQRGYGMDRRVFSLFEVHKWSDRNPPPECCDVVPVVFYGTEEEYKRNFDNLITYRVRAAERYGVTTYNHEGFMLYFTNSKVIMKHIHDK